MKQIDLKITTVKGVSHRPEYVNWDELVVRAYFFVEFAQRALWSALAGFNMTARKPPFAAAKCRVKAALNEQ